jgi:transposase
VPDAAAAPRPDAQKKTLRAEEQARADVAAERRAFEEGVRGLDPEDLVFVDEAGVTTAMARRYARAPKGRRAVGTAPCGSWRRLTVLGALTVEGVVAAMSIEAATGTAVFLAFLDQVLIPTLVRTKPDAVVVMDNLSAHKVAAVRARLERAGLRLLYLPRYAPELSPIEPCWSKVKELLRAKAARTVAALNEALGPALDAVSARDARGFFRGCGYAAPVN